MDDSRYKHVSVWGIEVDFDTMSLVDGDNAEILYNLTHLEDEDFPQDRKNPLDFYTLFRSSFGDEQWKSIKSHLRKSGKTTFADYCGFYELVMDAAGKDEGVEAKN